MRVEGIILGYEPREPALEIPPGARVGILLDHQTRRGVLDQKRAQAFLDAGMLDDFDERFRQIEEPLASRLESDALDQAAGRSCAALAQLPQFKFILANFRVCGDDKWADLQEPVSRSACSANFPPCLGVFGALRFGLGGCSVVYLRHSTVRKNGKKHVYWRLVRSVRRNGKVVQETVAQLGELDAKGRAKAKALARQITGRGDQCELFEDPASAEATASVRLDRVRVERGRCFGDVWLGWRLWQALRLDEWCEENLPRGREQVPWSTMAAVLVIARLCEPSSELHIAEDWYRRTALEDLLGLPADRINDDRLYRALDRLLPHKEALEQHLVKRLGELFDLSCDLLLYDVTSMYFEGQAERNPLAQRGHSRDHRPDCKQVCIALVVTREGMPLSYEVFAGNRTDVTTVEEIVEAMEKRYGIAQRVWVMDRGMSSADNVAWLQKTGRRYLIGAPKSELKKWSREIADGRDWQTVRDGVEAKVCCGPDGTETFLLCRSADRRKKERAMHERFSKRIEERLESLGRRLARSHKRLDRETIGRQIGRMLAQNSRAAGRYQIEVLDDPTRDLRTATRLEGEARVG